MNSFHDLPMGCDPQLFLVTPGNVLSLLRFLFDRMQYSDAFSKGCWDPMCSAPRGAKCIALSSQVNFCLWGLYKPVCCRSNGYGLTVHYLAMMSTKI
jgi:hypothetical protein